MTDLDQLSFKHPIVFIDGYCGLCSRWVKNITRKDKKGVFKFASAQSHEAFLKAKNKDDSAFLKSIVLLHKGKVYYKSDAVLEIYGLIGGWRKILTLFVYVPVSIRNIGYNFVAKHRYKVFGKNETCDLNLASNPDRLVN